MRILLSTFLLLFVSIISVNAQVSFAELGIGFQSFARSADGAALSNQTVSAKFEVYPDGSSNSIEFTETHNSISTDAFGVFNARIGSLNQADFLALDWTTKKYVLKVQVKVGSSSFVTISEKVLNTVPYAMASARAQKADEAIKADNGVAPGTIVPFAGPATSIPAGYVVCDGTGYDGSSNSYQALFEAIGTSWGTDGTKFRVPDLRGYFLRGFSDSQSTDPDKSSRTALYASGNTGNKVGSYQTDELKQHNHQVVGNTNVDGAHSHTDNSSSRADNSSNSYVGHYIGSYADDYNNTGGTSNIRPGGSDHKHAIDFASGNRGGNETRVKNAYVLYIIKL